MLQDLARAVALLPERRIRSTLLLSVTLAIAVLLLAIPILDRLLAWLGSTGYLWLDHLITALGAVATVLAAWFLFPVVFITVMGMFLERVVIATEERYLPGLPPARAIPLAEAAVGTARFTALAIVLNLACLPFYLVPGLNLPVFLALNGYLFGREYAELIASRRMAPAQVRELRRTRSGVVWRVGLVTAGLATVPFVNLVAPLIGSAFATLELHRSGALAGPRLQRAGGNKP